MIEDDFYATLKLKTGEEIFAKVAATDEEDRMMLLVTNPIVVEEIKFRGQSAGYKMEPWLKTTTDDMFILNMDDILTMSESNDFEMISMYQKYVRKAQSRGDETNNHQVLDRDTGLLSNVHDAKELLEKLYKLKPPYQP